MIAVAENYSPSTSQQQTTEESNEIQYTSNSDRKYNAQERYIKYQY